VWPAAGVQARSAGRKQNVPSHCSCYFRGRSIECVQFRIGMFICSTGEILLSFNLISHCSEPRSDRRMFLSVRRVDRDVSLLLGRPSGLAKAEEGNHTVYGNLVTSDSTEATLT